MIYTFPESQDAKLSNSAYGIVFGSVFMEIWTNLSTLQHHCNIFFAHCISNNVNTLVSEIFICEKIKRSMTLYMDFQSQRVNKVHFPSPFNDRTILSYHSVSCVVQYALFYCILFSAGEFMHLKGCDLCENSIPEVFF